MPDASAKSPRRRSFGGLLSSGTTPSSSSSNLPPMPLIDDHHHDSGRPPTTMAVSQDQRHPQNRRGKEPGKLQKRSRSRAPSPGASTSLFGLRGRNASNGNGNANANANASVRTERPPSSSFTMGNGSVQKGSWAADDAMMAPDYVCYGNNNNMPPSKHAAPSLLAQELPSQQSRQSPSPPLSHQQQLPPRPRSKSTQASLRKSVFGSLRSLGSVDDSLQSTRTRSKTSSDDEDFLMAMGLSAGGAFRGGGALQVLHYGEVQMTAAMWRKKTQYLVLTDTHLVRFKSQAKAADTFPIVPTPSKRGEAPTVNRQSVTSLASVQDGQLSGEGVSNNIPLTNVIACRPSTEDDRTSFAIEIWYIEEKGSRAASLVVHLSDYQDFDLWLSGIRGAAMKLHSSTESSIYDPATVDYLVRALEQEKDYDEEAFQVFRVAQRFPTKHQTSSSSNDAAKHSPPNLCYLVFGLHKIHIVPLPKHDRSSAASLNNGSDHLSLCLGFMCLSGFCIQQKDDDFQMSFRLPFKAEFPVYLSSIFCQEVGRAVWRRTEFLRPQWRPQPFTFNVPRLKSDETWRSSLYSGDHGCFDRTLTAYCAAYDSDTSNIRYIIDYNVEDAPQFQLMPRAGAKDGSGYTALELLAVLRSLRFNETFASISFAGVKLDVLKNLHDPHQVDADAVRARNEGQLRIPGQESMSILSREIRALALTGDCLRRMDFSFCLTKDPESERTAAIRDDTGCGIPEAIFPLCRRQLTHVDWIVLNGIKLVDADLDYMVDAASQKASNLRALEISHCGLSIHNLELLLSTLTTQDETMEAINISDVQGRVGSDVFQEQIACFTKMRKINVSHVTTGPESLIAPETLLQWRLEELCLSRMSVNEKTVASIAAYLASPQSQSLRVLRLDQCGLTGRDIAKLLPCMVDEEGRARDIQLYISENRLQVDYSYLVDAFANNQTPAHLTMRMIDFQKEEHFRFLIEALTKNTSLKYLDMSKASLPYDAGTETCQALQQMFEENTTLETLDISGEYAHLEVARFGIGLNQALMGLKRNSTLKVLKIEYQNLGLQGANTLASVIDENDSLREIYCEHNDMNLQAFTVLMNGLQRNKSIVYIPSMDRDREISLERVRREIEGLNDFRETKNASLRAGSAFRRTFAAATAGMRSTSAGNRLSKARQNANLASSSSQQAATPTPEARLVLHGLGKRWDEQAGRLHRYLYRNYHTTNWQMDESGQPMKMNGYATMGGDADWDGASDGRPATAASLGTMLQQISMEPVDPSTLTPPDEEEGEGLTMKLPRMRSFRSGTNRSKSRSGRNTPRRIDLSEEFAEPEPPVESSPSSSAFLDPHAAVMGSRSKSASRVPTIATTTTTTTTASTTPTTTNSATNRPTFVRTDTSNTTPSFRSMQDAASSLDVRGKDVTSAQGSRTASSRASSFRAFMKPRRTLRDTESQTQRENDENKADVPQLRLAMEFNDFSSKLF